MNDSQSCQHGRWAADVFQRVDGFFALEKSPDSDDVMDREHVYCALCGRTALEIFGPEPLPPPIDESTPIGALIARMQRHMDLYDLPKVLFGD